MKTFKTIKSIKSEIRRVKRLGKTIGFVPTMGYLHEGHSRLIRRARKETGYVVVSIFVNPAQFGPNEDFGKYPRDFRRDERICREEGVDAVFYPSVDEMYPDGYATYVRVEGLSGVMCGKTRKDHFRGVATIVAKLFNIVSPDYAYFGNKDFQQTTIIERMIRDLNLNVKIRRILIVREKDGLAMSSRNKYLNKLERKLAPVLYRSLKRGEEMIRAGCRSADKVISEIRRLILKCKYAKIDYIVVCYPDTLESAKDIKGKVLIAIAVFMGKTRLIDNIVVEVR